MRISDVMSQLASVWADWGSQLINPKYIRRDSEITWTNFGDSRLESFITSEDVRDIVDRGQYSFLIASDRSPIQIYYRFSGDGETLLAANLSYCKNHQTTVDQGAVGASVSEIEQEGESPIGVEEAAVLSQLDEDPAVYWVRFDFDPTAIDQSVVHATCHLQFSHMPDTRIAVVGVPTPLQFIDSVFRWFYPEVYKSLHLQSDGSLIQNDRYDRLNSTICRLGRDEKYQSISHLRVPEE